MNAQIENMSALETASMGDVLSATGVQIQQPAALSDRYVVEGKLGKGSQGQVWLATRKSDGVRVAIKQLNVHSVTTWKQYELFKREAEILESLNISGVAPFYEYIEDLDAKPPFVCIIQKYIEGKTLSEMLKSKHRFETEAIYDIVAQTLRILQDLHRHHPPVVHRDIKPSNLMLTPLESGRYHVTLLDFGAVANPQVQNGGSTVAGTFGYMPPEQLMGQAQPSSDIYALAAVAVELLSGTSPADIPVCDFKLVIEPYLTHVPSALIHTLHAMLEPSVENRICDHAALIAQFDALANKKQPTMLDILRRTAVSKLRDVEYICQPGNYEIWQNLGQTDEIDLTSCPCHLDLPKGGAYKPPIQWLLLIYVLVVLGIILIAIAFIRLWVLALFAVPVLGGAGFAIYKYQEDKKRKSILYPKVFPTQNVQPEHFSVFSDLLREGRKVVGRIACILYKDVDERYSTTHKEHDKIYVLSYDVPIFWVIYQFQYSHGEKDYTFYGQLTTHVAPENHYKVGDPVTLVADLKSYDDKTLKLSVIPYPYSFGDVLNADEVFYSCGFQPCELGDNLGVSDHQLALQGLTAYENERDMDAGIQSAKLYQEKFKKLKFAQKLYRQIAEHGEAQLKLGNTDAGLKSALIYRNNLRNDYRGLMLEDIVKAIKQYKAGDLNAGLRAAESYRSLYEEDHATHLVQDVIERYKACFDSGDTEAGITAANIYIKQFNDDQSANFLYRQVTERYIERFNAGDDEYAFKAADVYIQYLHDDQSANRMYRQVAQRYIERFNAGDNEYAFKAADVYILYLKDTQAANFLYHQVAQRYIERFNAGDNEYAFKAADVYIQHLNDEQSANRMYSQVAQRYVEQFNAGDDEYAFKAAHIYIQYLKDTQAAKFLYRQVLERCLERFHAGDDKALEQAVDLYREKVRDKTLIEQAAQQYLTNYYTGNLEAGLRVADIYKAFKLDVKFAEELYQEIVGRYMDKFHQGDPSAGKVAASIYKFRLSNSKVGSEVDLKVKLLESFKGGIIESGMALADIYRCSKKHTLAAKLYIQVGEKYVSRFQAGDVESGLKAADLYKKLKDSTLSEKIYKEVAEKYIEQFNAGDENALYRAADIYRNQLNNEEWARALLEQAVHK